MESQTKSDLPVQDAALAFAALGSEQRLQVLRALVRAGPEGLSVGELGERCGINGSTLTHHVRSLAQVGLVTQTRHGRTVICAAVAYSAIDRLTQFLHENCCADAPCCADGVETTCGPPPHSH